MAWINLVKAAVSAVVTAAPYVLKGAPIVWEGAPLIDGGLSKSIERKDDFGVALKVGSVALGALGTGLLAFGLVSNPVGWGIVAASLAVSLYDTWEDAKHDAREKLAKEKSANLGGDIPIKPATYAAVDTERLQAKPDPAAELAVGPAKDTTVVAPLPKTTEVAADTGAKQPDKIPTVRPA